MDDPDFDWFEEIFDDICDDDEPLSWGSVIVSLVIASIVIGIIIMAKGC